MSKNYQMSSLQDIRTIVFWNKEDYYPFVLNNIYMNTGLVMTGRVLCS